MSKTKEILRLARHVLSPHNRHEFDVFTEDLANMREDFPRMLTSITTTPVMGSYVMTAITYGVVDRLERSHGRYRPHGSGGAA